MNPQTVSIALPNGQNLSGTLFHRADIRFNQAIVICSGTGFLQTYYAAFATWLAAQGYTVLTFDYDGIGPSLQGDLKHCSVGLQDWGTRDIPAAVDFLLAHTGLPQALLIGHSAGSQMLGVMPNHAKIAKVIAIAGSTGHLANMRPEFARKANFLFTVYMPLSNLVFGYAKLKAIKWGEDLPRHVARQWAQWCKNGHYVRTAIDRGDIEHDFHTQITQPITVIHAEDDDIANAANVAEFLSTFPNAIKTTRCLNPQTYGFKHIGHNHILRPSHQKLWDIVLQEIQLL
ncbi:MULTISPECIES: alpha/beta hydrolase family protein [Vitreoscilla]|uniref:Alpha/beta fold hydrolase n=1 Tax=Vitreoscilla stercoraria TaxID=61 RepID=A0ABY4ECK4_VITST|nr:MULTISPECIES: alpha/beta fold hydrolase [Vitreoscilla]AUZ05565.1 hypothetical protein ADP71_21340 [Vitreoscilla sp. C1]UOO93021.1 alpha/beta fold hydrolase [Vitreoscilla stercoraria]